MLINLETEEKKYCSPEEYYKYIIKTIIDLNPALISEVHYDLEGSLNAVQFGRGIIFYYAGNIFYESFDVMFNSEIKIKIYPYSVAEVRYKDNTDGNITLVLNDGDVILNLFKVEQ